MTIISGEMTIFIWAAMGPVAATAMAWAFLNAAVAQDGPVVSPAVSMEILKHINTGSPSSFPETLVEVDGVLLFSAYDGTHDGALWKSDARVTGPRWSRTLLRIRISPYQDAIPRWPSTEGFSL